jgi:hypothetical protein
MAGNEDCGMAQGNGKDNGSGLLNLFLLDGLTGEKGNFACNVGNTGVVIGVGGDTGGTGNDGGKDDKGGKDKKDKKGKKGKNDKGKGNKGKGNKGKG